MKRLKIEREICQLKHTHLLSFIIHGDSPIKIENNLQNTHLKHHPEMDHPAFKSPLPPKSRFLNCPQAISLLISNFHDDNVETKHEGNGVRNYDGKLLDQDAISEPHSHAQRQKAEHPQGEVFSVPGLVCLYDLRDQR